MSVPTELVLAILRRPELKGCTGLLRCVCFDWKHLVSGSKVRVSIILGNVRAFEWAAEAGYLPSSYYDTLLGEYGGIDVLEKHILSRSVCNKVSNGAANVGSTNVRRISISYFSTNVWKGAAKRGSIEVLEMFLPHARPLSGCEEACELAAENGHLEALKWLRKHKAPWCCNTISGAIIGGHIEVLEWAYENGCESPRNPAKKAAFTGNTDMLKWFESKDFPMDGSTSQAAATRGHLDTLKWLVSRGFQMSEFVCSEAAINGHIHVLTWIKENNYPWNPDACTFAAARGRIDVLKWAAKNGYPCNTSVCKYAARGWRLDCLKWAVANGAWIDIDECIKAADEGFLLSSLCDSNRRKDKIGVVEWLKSIKV